MIAVIFELTPKPAFSGRYFEIAGELREQLSAIDGFVSVERFESLSQPGRYLSLSFWRDADAVRRWRNQGQHRLGQQEGRDSVFADYRLRVAEVLRDYGLHDREQVPQDSRDALR